MMHPNYMATPIYDSVAAATPYPTLKVDTSFTWKRPAAIAPRPGQKPRRKKGR